MNNTDQILLILFVQSNEFKPRQNSCVSKQRSGVTLHVKLEQNIAVSKLKHKQVKSIETVKLIQSTLHYTKISKKKEPYLTRLLQINRK